MAISKTKIFKENATSPPIFSGFPPDLGIKVGSQKKDRAIYTLSSLSSLLNSDFGKSEVPILGSLHDYGLLTT